MVVVQHVGTKDQKKKVCHCDVFLIQHWHLAFWIQHSAWPTSRRNSWADLSSGESPVVSLGRNDYPEWSKNATGQGLLMGATWYNHGDNRNKLGSPTVVKKNHLELELHPQVVLVGSDVWKSMGKQNQPPPSTNHRCTDKSVICVSFLGVIRYTDVRMLLDSLRISQIAFRVLVDVAWQSSPVVIPHSQFPQILGFACFRKIYTGGTVL
jgi:hypothetical protein